MCSEPRRAQGCRGLREGEGPQGGPQGGEGKLWNTGLAGHLVDMWLILENYSSLISGASSASLKIDTIG